jgi:hypothetical protein
MISIEGHFNSLPFELLPSTVSGRGISPPFIPLGLVAHPH